MNETLNISNSEWEVMRIVWTLKEAKSHEIIDNLAQKTSWSSSTIKTLIGRLVKKNYLAVEKDGRSFIYKPLISERETNDSVGIAAFDNMCAMCAGHTLLNVVDHIQLSKNDIEILIKKLEGKLETAPDTIMCDCLTKVGKEAD